MNDLPEHLLPQTNFKPVSLENSVELQGLNNSAPVGSLSPEDQHLIDVLTAEKHSSALEILLEEERKKRLPAESVIPEVDPRVENLTAYLETRYWLQGGYPFFEELLRETGYTESQMRQTLVKASIKLRSRGLPSYTVPPSDEESIFEGWTSEYDPRFVLACNIVASTSDKRTLAAKLDEVEVTVAEWDGWLLNKKNYDYFKLLVETRWNQLDEVAKLGIIRGVQMGDLSTIKYFHEFTGKHVQNSVVTINTSSVIQRVIEVLSKHLTPDMLNTVANDLQLDNLVDTTAKEVLPLERG